MNEQMNCWILEKCTKHVPQTLKFDLNGVESLFKKRSEATLEEGLRNNWSRKTIEAEDQRTKGMGIRNRWIQVDT